MPLRLMSPCVVENPTRLFNAEGMTVDPPVSLPSPTVLNHAAIATPVPELDPPEYLVGLYGLTV